MSSGCWSNLLRKTVITTTLHFPVEQESECIRKNHTHVKKVGHTSEFLLGIYWWTWKTTIYWKITHKAGCTSEFLFGIYWWTSKNYSLKNCWSGPIKNVRILIFTMLYFLKKNKENTWSYRYFTPVYLKSWWYDLQFLRYSVTDWNW